MELSLVKGEMVVLSRRIDGNWYEGRIGSRRGIFPATYIDVMYEPGDTKSKLSIPYASITMLKKYGAYILCQIQANEIKPQETIQ